MDFEICQIIHKEQGRAFVSSEKFQELSRKTYGSKGVQNAKNSIPIPTVLEGRKGFKVFVTLSPIETLRGNDVSLAQTEIDNLQASSYSKVIAFGKDAVSLTKITLLPVENQKDVERDWKGLFIRPFIQKYELNGIAIYVNNVLEISKERGKQKFWIQQDDSTPHFGYFNTNTMIALGDVITPEEVKKKQNREGYDDLGGIQGAVAEIRAIVELPLTQPHLFEAIGTEVPRRGILLYGPPGSGKTKIARAIAHETGVFFNVINGPDIVSMMAGESESNLRKAFEVCSKNAPSILFIDEIDAIAPKRDKVQGELEKRMVAQLLTLMDGLNSQNVIVLAATNRPNSVDPALRRPGRFDKEINIGIPDLEGRLHILKIHTRTMKLADDVDLREIAKDCHGFVGADITALVADAALIRIRTVVNPEDSRISIAKDKMMHLKVTMDDFRNAMEKITPSALRENSIEKPDVKWESIGGLASLKDDLQDIITNPIKYADQYKNFGITPARGVLFYGPPGTGKTLLAKAIASNCNANFISVKGPELLTMWFGESEANIRDLFHRARSAAPCIIFLDELDSIAPKRGQGESSGTTDRIINQLLLELDGMEARKGVIIVAATNRPQSIDSALLRPGRLDQMIFVDLPNTSSREDIFKVYIRKHVDDSVNFGDFAARTNGYSGADIAEICQKACRLSIKQWIDDGTPAIQPKITTAILTKALNNTPRSVSDKEMREYKLFEENQRKRGVTDENDVHQPENQNVPVPAPINNAMQNNVRRNNNYNIDNETEKPIEPQIGTSNSTDGDSSDVDYS